MKTILAAMVAVLAVAAMGCGSGGIPDVPLAGTVKGSAFTAKGAIATAASSAGERRISISDVELTCDDLFKSVDRKIIFSTEWKAGPAKNLGLFSQTVTFVTGGSNNNIALDGQLEIVSAPAEAGSKAKVKLRATAGDDTVEGAVDVTVCDSSI